MDSCTMSDRIRRSAVAWSSLNPSERRRWTNFRVSKWWSLCVGLVEENARVV